MNKIFAVARKELRTYFKSPIAYIFLILTITIFNIFFFMIIDQNREVSLRDVFRVMEFMFIFLVPLLTMGIFSEEKSTGTMEFLQTAPLTNTAIVLGKYLGILIFFTIIISMTVIYYGIVEYFGTPDPLTTLTGYLGIWLEGAFFLALGMMTSSWTRNQIVSAMVSYVILFLIYFSISFTKYFSGPAEIVIQQLSTGRHLENFAVGLIAIADVVYYLTGIIVCLVLTRLSIENRRKKAGVILTAILFLAVFYAGINYVGFSLPWRWDVTRAKQHTLTTSTVEFVEGLKTEVQLTALYVGLPPKYLEDLFKEYERNSQGKIKTEIIDPIEQLGYAAQFGNVVSGKERKVIVRAGNERRDVDFTQSSLSEEQLTNAIVRVTREERHVYFLTGHGEFAVSNEEDQGLSLFAKLLDSNNMTSQNLMLGIEENIPEECDVLIIAGPRNDLTEKEETMIEAYLKKGGDALFLIEHVIVTTPDKPLTDEEKHKNPSLNNILNQWGVNIQEDIVVDLSSHAGEDVGSPATRNYMPHKAITKGLDYTFYVRPRSITVLEGRRSSIKLAPIVLTATKKASWAETNRTLEIHFDEAEDTPGPVPISFVLWEEKEEGDHSDTRIIVFTDADFLTNVYINQYSNAAMGLNIVNWLAESDYKVFLDQKEIKVERLDLTSKQKRKIAALLFLMPVFIAVGGGVVWMKARFHRFKFLVSRTA